MKKKKPVKSKGQNSPNNRRPISPFAPARKVVLAALDRAVIKAESQSNSDTQKVVPALAVVSAETRLLSAKFHRDYRVVLSLAIDAAMSANKITYLQRSEFENLGESDRFKTPENPIACLIRALGRFETAYFEKYGILIADDGFVGTQWLGMWQSCRFLLSSTMTGNLPGGFCWTLLEALAKNAGFSASDYA